jgi:hypothetical protein
MTAEKQPLEFTNVSWLLGMIAAFLVGNNVAPISAYLEHRWPAVALGGIVFGALVLMYREGESFSLSKLTRLNWLLLTAYLVHQFEEHGVDVFGRIYYFHEYANAQLAAQGITLTPLAILKINTISVWMGFLLAVWGGSRYKWPGLAAAGMTLINAVFHITMAVANGEYNPGVLTAVVLFLPISIFYFGYVRTSYSVSFWEIGGGVAFGIAGHAVLPSIIAAGAPMLVLVPMTVLPLVANVAKNALPQERYG